MTIDEAFDRIETVPTSEVRAGDMIQVDPGSAPKEVDHIEVQGGVTKFGFVDKTYRFVTTGDEVALCME